MTGHVRTIKVKRGWDRPVRSVKGSELSYFHYFGHIQFGRVGSGTVRLDPNTFLLCDPKFMSFLVRYSVGAEFCRRGFKGH